jgi:hypothetical protein
MLEWWEDYLWGIPMIIGCLGFHVSGLVGIEAIFQKYHHNQIKSPSLLDYLIIISVASTTILIMHVIESVAWAILYIKLSAFGDMKTSMLYSLNALTSYGHENTQLHDQWRLLGAIESMNGVLIFGLTTAYLFSLMNEIRPSKKP